MEEVKELYTIKEPLKGYELQFGIVPTNRIVIPSIQRDLSEQLVKRLMFSIEKIGFVDPVLLIEKDDNTYEVINGQHRVEAAKAVGLDKVLAIVLPKELKNFILSLNIEKAPNLKDKAHQAYEIFMEHLKNNPDMEEYELETMIEEPYYITVGFITDRFGDKRFPGYAFEKVLKKVDNFTSLSLKDAETEREQRANLLEEVKDILNSKYEELGLTNALHKEAIVSKAFQMIYGKRVRTVEDDFYETLKKLKEAIPKVTLTEEEIQ